MKISTFLVPKGTRIEKSEYKGYKLTTGKSHASVAKRYIKSSEEKYGTTRKVKVRR